MGYDPGVNGGLAVCLPTDDPLYLEPLRPSFTEKDVLGLVKGAVDTLRLFGGDTCYVEKVHFIRGDGGKGSFTFGGIYRLVRGMLLMADIKLTPVYPMMWQASMRCMTGGDKRASRDRAKELFPGMEKQITHNTADAALIARYGALRLAALAS